MINRRTAVLGLPALLGGCATQNAADGAVLGADEGLLVLQRSGNGYGTLGYDRWGDRTLGAQLSEGLLGMGPKVAFGWREELFVAPLAAGEYMWTKLSIDQHYAWLQKSTRFSIVRGAITYVGDLRVSISPGLKEVVVLVSDREADARTALAKQYPRYLNGLSFQKRLAEMKVSRSENG